jgi:antitoxin component YwqK of YwqJK toxin-antitoxin module
MNGYKQGYWKKHYESGGIRYKGFFRDNKPVGKLTRYYESGVKMADLDYSDDGITATAILYYQNNSKAAEGKFINQIKDGAWKYYSYYTETVVTKETYSMGNKHGLSAIYYDNGQVAQTTMWENNLKHGPWKQYYEDTSIRLVSQHNNDKMDGLYQVFSEQGNVIIEGVYENDKPQGSWKYYLDNGTLDFELIYVDGVLQNEDALKQKLEEFMEEYEKNAGKIPEPDLDNIVPQ